MLYCLIAWINYSTVRTQDKEELFFSKMQNQKIAQHFRIWLFFITTLKVAPIKASNSVCFFAAGTRVSYKQLAFSIFPWKCTGNGHGHMVFRSRRPSSGIFVRTLNVYLCFPLERVTQPVGGIV